MKEKAYRFQLHFNAMHNIEPDKPEKMHAHTFRIIVYLRGDLEDITVYNQCETVVRDYLKRFQGTRLNHMPQFKDRIPRLEVICEVFFEEMDKILASNQVSLIKLEIGDSPLSTYSIAKELLVGSIYHRISEEEYQIYLNEMQERYE